MAKVVSLHGQRPGGWSKDRFAWRKSVIADQRLNATAKLLANELAFGFSNHETGECSPGIATLCDALGLHRATVMRALADLVAAGWIDRRGGEGPGKRATYAFTRPARVQSVAPNVSQPCDGNVSQVCAERVAHLRLPPIPPYKDKPNMNQKGATPEAGRKTYREIFKPLPTKLGGAYYAVAFGSHGEAAWRDWLALHGLDLGRVGERAGPDAWAFPLSMPPRDGEEHAQRRAAAWVAWLRSCKR